MSVLVLPIGLLVCGLIVLFQDLRNAPEGCQDEEGFHFVWSNNSPEISNVSCVWWCCTQYSVMSEDAEMGDCGHLSA